MERRSPIRESSPTAGCWATAPSGGLSSVGSAAELSRREGAREGGREGGRRGREGE